MLLESAQCRGGGEICAPPCLDLDWGIMSPGSLYHDEDFCKSSRKVYVKHTEQVLRQYKDHELSSFQLSFCFHKAYTFYVDQWLNFAADKPLRSLNLRFYCSIYSNGKRKIKKDELVTISSIFLAKFRYLKELHLHSCILNLHSKFTFSGLATVDLSFVLLEGVQWSSLLNNSSTIEWLKLRSCTTPKKLSIRENLWKLSFLMIHDCKHLREIEINAKNLTTFEFIADTAVKCSFKRPSSVENVFVYLREKDNGAEYMLTNLAESLSSLKHVILKGEYPLIHKVPIYPDTLFRCVLRLNLIMRLGDTPVIANLPHLLKSFPLLEKLHVQVPFLCVGGVTPPPPCLHTNLKIVDISGFYLDWIEIPIFLVKSAIALEHISITREHRMYAGCGEWSKFSNQVFCEKQCELIQEKLEGHFLSRNAKVIIW